MNCFWFWNFRLPYFNLLCIIFFLAYKKVKKEKLNFARKEISIGILFLLAQILGSNAETDIMKFIGAIIYSFVVTILTSLSPTLQYKLFNFIYKSFALIVGLSAALFLLLLFNIPIPSLGYITHPLYDFYWYDNYILLIQGCYGIRFNAIFCEPGHLGMIIAFLLTVKKINLKNKFTIILLFAQILTLSLAGYILTFIGYILNLFIDNRKKLISQILKGGCTLLIIYLFTVNYNNGKNLVNELIFSRLEYDKEEGTISGDNRASEYLQEYYDNLKGEDLIFGISEKKMNLERESLAGSGYTIYIVANGLIGVLAVFIFYFKVSTNGYKRENYWILLILYSLSFVQRAYPFWATEVYLFILANGVFSMSSKNIVLHKTRQLKQSK